jgi:AcrR family transcriptional regulator
VAVEDPAAVTRASTRRGYHHGDLRETLLKLALVHIAAEGTERLSLRALAREAGVSPTAPYRHFPSKRCLLAALITRGFRGLEQRLKAARDAAGDELEAQFLAVGNAYVQFALDNPTCYHLMFSTVLEDFSEYAELKQASVDSYGVMLDILEALLARGPGRDIGIDRGGGVAWAAVHGLASLLLFGLDRGGPAGDRTPLQSLAALARDPDAALRLLLRGLTG